MGKRLDEVTDEDLARNGLVDFSINPRPVMPWRTEKHRLTGVPPTEEEWQAVIAPFTEEALQLDFNRRFHPERLHPNFGRF